MSSDIKKVTQKAEKRGIPNAARHVFFCNNSGCCKEREEAKAAGKKLSRAAKASRGGECAFEMTRVGCFGLCANGPLAVVYPEGVWYANVDEKAAEKIIEHHLQNGEVVEELVFARSGANPRGRED